MSANRLDHLETSFKPQILDSDDGTPRELKIPAPQCVVDATLLMCSTPTLDSTSVGVLSSEKW